MDKQREQRIKNLLAGRATKCHACGGDKMALSGRKLRQVRLGAGLGVRELARMVEISAPYLSDMEMGRRNLGLEMADKLLKGMGL